MWAMTHSHVRHDSFTCETWLIHMWDITHSVNYSHAPARRKRTSILEIPRDMNESWLTAMTHSHLRHDSLIHLLPRFSAARRKRTSILGTPRDMTRLCVRYERFICETWDIHRINRTLQCTFYEYVMIRFDEWHIHWIIRWMTHSSNKSHAPAHRERTCILESHCDMSCSYEWHDPLIYETRSSVSQAYLHSKDVVWHDSLICEPWLILLWDMTHSLNGYHTPAGRKRTSILKILCDMTHSYVSHNSFTCETWLIHWIGTTLQRVASVPPF